MNNQDCETPRDFIAAVEAKFGPIAWDLAAQANTCKARDPLAYFDRAHDSLIQDWAACGTLGRTWLNPPFANLKPWLVKAHACRAISAPLVLLPASVCTEYFDAFVRWRAMVYEVTPRPFAREVRDVILADFREVPAVLPGGGVERRFWRWQQQGGAR